MLVHRSVAHFVQFVQLSLELHEVFASFTVNVDHACLELFEGVNHFEEVALIEEVVVITCLAFLCYHLWRDDQCVLAKVLLELVVGVLKQRAERLSVI